MEMQESLGEYIKRKREALELSQRALAKKAGISPTTVTRIEADEIVPGTKTLESLANALNIPLSRLTDVMQGRLTKDDKHPLISIIDSLPPQAQRLVEKVVRAIAEEYSSKQIF